MEIAITMNENPWTPIPETPSPLDWFNPEMQQRRTELTLADLPTPSEVLNALAKSAGKRPCRVKDPKVRDQVIALFAALDSDKEGNLSSHTRELSSTGTEEALADVILSVFQKAVSLNVNIGQAVMQKHDYNQRY